MRRFSPRLVEQHRRAPLAGGVAQRAVTDPRVQHHRRREGRGQRAGAVVVEVGADLRQVGAAVGAGVQVDADLALGDHLVHEQVGDPAGQRPARRARERAVEVAAVGQVAVAGHEAEHVDDRHRDQRAAHRPGVEVGQHLADHLDADHLVAVDRGVDPDRRPVLAPVDDPHRQAHVGAGHQPGDRQLQCAGRPRTDPDLADPERLPRHHLPRLRRRTDRFGRPPR